MNKQDIYSRHLYLTGEGTTELITRCEALMKREKWSFNQLVREALKEYELRHGAGNNSFTLDKFGITWTKAQSVNKCGFTSCDKLAIAVGLYVPKSQVLGLCKLHYDVAKNNRHVWKDLKISTSKATQQTEGGNT